MPWPLPLWLLPKPLPKKKRKLPKGPEQHVAASRRPEAALDADVTQQFAAHHKSLHADFTQQAAVHGVSPPLQHAAPSQQGEEAQQSVVVASSSSVTRGLAADVRPAKDMAAEVMRSVKRLSVSQARHDASMATAESRALIAASTNESSQARQVKKHMDDKLTGLNLSKRRRTQNDVRKVRIAIRRCGQCKACLKPSSKQGCMVRKAVLEAAVLQASLPGVLSQVQSNVASVCTV